MAKTEQRVLDLGWFTHSLKKLSLKKNGKDRAASVGILVTPPKDFPILIIQEKAS